ncbi:MAG: NAD(+) diphosphatase [Deltaproteobacteria bacterium]|nr:NAD(+) diphosphatase [Deltaproteobacteria bacterium]
MKFVKTVNAPETPWSRAFFLLFNEKGHLLVEKKNDTCVGLPCFDNAFAKDLTLRQENFLGFCDSTPCYCAGLNDGNLPGQYQWHNLRALFPQMEPEFWEVIGYAKQINDCHANNKFCGKCGKKTEQETNEHARTCHQCNLTFYPRISPAIITAVVKEDTLLLARGINFPNKKMFSVLAGFVEPQERLEDCVKREVFEETGIKVKNVSYFDSQPWPFPDSLMVGFTAEYEGGRLSIDPKEIAEAGWFTADRLPLVPGKPTLSGELIHWFVKTQKKKD